MRSAAFISCMPAILGRHFALPTERLDVSRFNFHRIDTGTVGAWGPYRGSPAGTVKCVRVTLHHIRSPGGWVRMNACSVSQISHGQESGTTGSGYNEKVHYTHTRAASGNWGTILGAEICLPSSWNCWCRITW